MSERVESEVWALEKCSGCGMCVALCSKGMLYWDEVDHPAREVREKRLGLSHLTLDSCTFCQKFCEEGCPRLEEEWTALLPRRLVSARAVGIVKSDEPNDVIKNLLVAALSAGLIDGVLMMDMNPWTLEPEAKVATSVREIVDTLGVQYLWTPVLSSLNQAIFERGLRNLAIVGTPCVAEAVRALRSSDNERLRPYQDAIRLTIAPFCTGVYFPTLVNDFLTGEMDLAPHSVKRLVAHPGASKLVALLWDGSSREIPVEKVEKYTRRGCAICDDYLGESADIAVGTVGAKDGYCTLITRSQVGDICLQNAVNFRLVETVDEVDEAALVKAKEEKERRERAQAFEKLMVLALDALGDPRKRAEIRQEYVRLYEIERPAESEKEQRYVTCAGC
jgi:coenzyme F420 hydrogenase subunit beta